MQPNIGQDGGNADVWKVFHYLPCTDHVARNPLGVRLGYQFERFRDVGREEIVAEKSPFRALRQLRIIAAFDPVSCVPTENEIQDEATSGASKINVCERATKPLFACKDEPR